MSAEPPRRIAHVWTIEAGILRVPLAEFPLALMLGAFVYEANVNAKGEPIVYCGRRTLVEIVDYRRRRAIRADDFPVADAVRVVSEAELHGE
jgi:hypothetical protein